MRLLLSTLLVLPLLFAGPPTAVSAASTYVVVEPVVAPVQRAWDVYAELRRIDVYTGSRIVVRKCRAGERCVRIFQTTRVLHPACRGAGGCALYSKGSKTWTITLNPVRVKRKADRRATVLHELGHVFGIAAHRNTGCKTWAMYLSVSCPDGSPVGKYFTTTERAILRRY